MARSDPKGMASDAERSAWLAAEVQTVLKRRVKDVRWDTLGFNNHLAFVNLEPTATSSNASSTGADLVDDVVVRIPRDKGSNANPALKIENEVAALQLARMHGILCPQILHWSHDPLYVVQSKLPGTPTKEVWHTLSQQQQAKFLRSLARTLKRLRSIPLPTTPQAQYGGFRFDASPNSSSSSASAAKVTLGSNPLGFPGPSPALSASLREFFDWQMSLARKNEFIQGWTAKVADPPSFPFIGLSDRLRAFADDQEKGLDKVLRDAELEAGRWGRPVFVHGDFDLHNTLIDTDTFELTGIVDFEFARAAPAWAEHFDGFTALGHVHYGPEDDDEATRKLGEALLHTAGWSSESNPIPPAEQNGQVAGLSGDKPGDAVWWETVRAWDDACAAEGLGTPRAMGSAFATASRLHWFISDVCPWQLEDAVSESAELDEEERAAQLDRRERTARRLDRFLHFWGF
ncbi:hypothetical protein OC842_004423 [Tilletia horrida]|uniref:Aminoglycoside phosphotransferase domain-containing protein n=1 Tax=Tilletia horrida TaxID=155126 RepID=A0AAN6JQA5_9BASI|nr:hypothetical protein OC842_004423 [Tilletia horrida]